MTKKLTPAADNKPVIEHHSFSLQNLGRAWRILSTVWRYRLDVFLPSSGRPLAASLALLPARLFSKKARSDGERLRLALQDLGPVFVKFGQMLSTRPDLIPGDIAQSLNELQENVNPIDASAARAVVEAAFGESTDTLFERFDQEPLASASIAQVHTARLKHTDSLEQESDTAFNPEVVVKIVRPGIERIIEKDMALLLSIASIAERVLPDADRLKPLEVVSEYQHVIGDEMNMQLEAANTSQLRRNFDNSELLYVPEIHWDYVRSNVLVMERIYGVQVTDLKQLRANNTNMKELAERGVEIFFSQVFRDSFFHADMHPGNIYVDVSKPDTPKYIALDCAIIGTLDEQDLYYLARNLLAIFNRDYRTVAEMHIESGWVPEHIRAAEFESAIRSVCEPIFQKPLAEISFGQILLYLFTVARRFEMSVQPNLVLLQKTLLAVEGLGRQLYPQLDLWQTAQPFLEQWMAKRYAPAEVMQRLQKQAPSLMQQLPQLPELVVNNLKSSAYLQDSSQQQAEQLAELNSRMQRRDRRQKIAAAVLVLLAATLTLAPENPLLSQLELGTPAMLLGGLGIALFLLG